MLMISFSPNSVACAVLAFSWMNCRFSRWSIGSVTERFRSTVTRVEAEGVEGNGTLRIVEPERGDSAWRERREEMRAEEDESSRVRYEVDEVVACRGSEIVSLRPTV